MSIYTYIVNHGNEDPAIGAGDIINGGKLESVMFYDALKRLEEAEEFIRNLRDETKDDQTKYSIDDFLN